MIHPNSRRLWEFAKLARLMLDWAMEELELAGCSVLRDLVPCTTWSMEIKAPGVHLEWQERKGSAREENFEILHHVGEGV